MRRVGRAVAAIAGIAFGCAAYLYLSLPDVRVLRSSNPTTTAFMELRAREAHANGEDRVGSSGGSATRGSLRI